MRLAQRDTTTECDDFYDIRVFVDDETYVYHGLVSTWDEPL